ncbi:hypothetical protein AwDysgo_12430 [Bacteroidales bacterium]|nr:hypothetical protein AwDysgo_12430 [Bacteroidales bacterium]
MPIGMLCMDLLSKKKLKEMHTKKPKLQRQSLKFFDNLRQVVKPISQIPANNNMNQAIIISKE